MNVRRAAVYIEPALQDLVRRLLEEDKRRMTDVRTQNWYMAEFSQQHGCMPQRSLFVYGSMQGNPCFVAWTRGVDFLT